MYVLKFAEDSIRHWAERNTSEDYLTIQNDIVPRVRERGYVERADFLTVCEWKSPRTRPRCAKNSEGFVREVTRASLGTHDERLRIEVLTLLDGVGWPTASVFLHFFSNDKYPILDYRALRSLSTEPPPEYDFAHWWGYVEFCRELATRNHLSMRTLDRALWQYSKENQKPQNPVRPDA